MSKSVSALVSLLSVACVRVLIHPASTLLAAAGIVSALVLIRILKPAGTDSRPDGPRPGRFLRYAAAGLVAMLAPGLVWAKPVAPTSFNSVTTVLPTPGITLGQTEGVGLDSLGNVYIADANNNRIVEVSAAGVASVVAFPGLSPALSTPSEVAVDGSGNLYVSDSGNARVVELSAGGVASVVNTGSLLTDGYPFGLALDAAGDLYISDAAHHDIVEVPAGGAAAVLVITGLGTRLNVPRGVAVDLSGNLYIADDLNNRIVKVTTPVGGTGAGTVLTITGLSTALNAPVAVALDGLGNLYIADSGNNRVVTVTPTGVSAVLSLGSYTLNSPIGVAVSVWGAIYIADLTNAARIVEAQPTSVGFGHLQNGAVTGTTLTLPFTLGSNETFGSAQALTLGTQSLDFTVASTACASEATSNAGCTVNVTFLPTAPGLRLGEVVLYNNATPPVPIISVPLYGTADAPLATLSPGTASVISTGGVVTSLPFQIALDGAGNMYVADYTGSNVVKVAAGGGSASVVNTGSLTLSNTAGVALDGAGDLFIADHFNSRIVEVTAGGVASVLNITGLTTGLNIPTVLDVDAAGNLYIADYGNGRIVKVTPAGAGSVLATGSYTLASQSVTGVAVDAAGAVYIADRDNNRVVKVTASGAASLVVPAGITPILANPQGVGVDAFGNLYIADSGNNRIVEVTSAEVASVVPIIGLTSPTTLGGPFGVSVDPSGNVLIPDFDNSRIVKVNVSGASLAFPNTDVGSTSSPQTATVTNIGDLPLIFATVPTYTVNFSEDTGDTNLCALSTSLDAGTVCDVSVEFTPQSGGSLSAGIVVTNNSLNLTATTQNVAVSGTGVSVADTTAVTVSTNPSSVVLGQAIAVTAVVTDTTTGHTATIPTGGVTFMDTVGSTTVQLNGGAAVTLNGAGAAILTGVTLAGGGLHTITANYVGVTGTFLASSNTTTVQVATGPIAPTIVWTAPAGGLTYGTTLSGILNATAVSGSTPVAGTFTYTATLAGGSPIAVTGATVLGGGSYTLTAAFTPTDPTTYASTSASASLTVAKATPTLALASSAASVGVGSAVTFTATVSFTSGTPSGSVSFYDGTTLLGSGTLAMGVATYTTTNLPVGALSITAVYSGDSNFSTVTSAALTESVMTGFTLTAPTTPVTIAPGGSVMVNLTVPPLGGAFTNVVTLSASGLPPGATATFNPSAVTPGSDGAATVLTIQLAAATARIPASDLPARHGRFPVAPFSLAFVLFSTVLGRKRIPRALVLGLALAVLGMSTMFVTGCGGGSATTQSTPAGNYTVKLTGSSGTSQASTIITLVVQ